MCQPLKQIKELFVPTTNSPLIGKLISTGDIMQNIAIANKIPERSLPQLLHHICPFKLKSKFKIKKTFCGEGVDIFWNKTRTIIEGFDGTFAG